MAPGRERRGEATAGLAVLPAALARLRPGAATFAPDPATWLRANLAVEVEQRRLFPWIAVAFGAGVCLAFAADGPLRIWPPLLGAALALAAAIMSRNRTGLLAIAIGTTALFGGFAAVAFRLEGVKAPVLARMLVAKLSGTVETVEERAKGGRILIRLDALDRVDPAARPERVRVTTRSLAGVRPGDRVTAVARLMPPPEAARPGGYDFARDAYFRGIGAVGSISGRIATAEPLAAGGRLWDSAAARVDDARNVFTTRIASSIGGQPGAVAASLITGKRGLIDDHSNDVLRAAGIYHVVPV